MTLRLNILLWFGWVFFVIYGSLLPFDFQPMALDRAIAGFRHMPFLRLAVDSRADWVANGVLYFPIGLLTARLLTSICGRSTRTLAAALALAFGVALACAIEFAQQFFPPRTVSQNDLMAESIGTLIGVLLAPPLDAWATRLRSVWGLGGARLLLRLLEAYAAAYLLLALFPFDLLLSVSEWQAKIDSNAWGWLLAGSSMDRGWLVGVLLGVEVLLAVPLGALFVALRPARPRSLGVALVWGCVIGLGVELAQLAIASGISQGVSIMTRGLGLALGVWGWQWWAGRGLDSARHSLGRSSGALALVYLVLLLLVNGWWTHRWHGLEAVASGWHMLRLMPFYYHYYTTEAQAMFSLGSVAMMYLPVAMIGWARKWKPGAIYGVAALLALCVEASKLFMQGLRPDPSNPLIAVAACWLAVRLLQLVTMPLATAHSTSATVSTTPDQGETRRGGPGWFWVGAAMLVAILSAWLMPTLAWPIVAVLAVCAVLAWRWPIFALFMVPAALPVFDLAPWTGRFFWNEFDLLLLVVLSIGWHRSTAQRRISVNGLTSAQSVAMLLLGVSLVISTLRVASPWQLPDLNSFNNYYSAFNALRIGKAGIWALAFIALYLRLAQPIVDKLRVFAWGMGTGLLLTVLVVIWERLAFVDLFDFDSDYRVTGPFSAMHTGGAIIECYLGMATAFLLWLLIDTRSLVLRALGAVLLVGATYALMVTYSRNGYAVMLAVMLVSFGAVLLRPGDGAGGRLRPQRLAALVFAALMAVAVWPVLQGSFAMQRLARTAADQAIRVAHWRDALQMRDDDWATTLFGVGLGRFPATHYWRSAEPVHAASYSLVNDQEGTFLRLGTGSPVYIEQFVPAATGQRYTLSLDVRSTASAKLGVALCEKWMLTSRSCHMEAMDVAAAPGWRKLSVTMSTQDWPAHAWYQVRPVKLTLFNRGGPGSIDVDNVTLDIAPGSPMLSNGDFARGLDHWFFSADRDPPWHIHSLPVTLLFELGWFGLLVWGLAMVLAIFTAAMKVWRGETSATPILAALLAVLVSGALNTLINDPRLLMLILVLLWLGGSPAGVGGTSRRKQLWSPENP